MPVPTGTSDLGRLLRSALAPPAAATDDDDPTVRRILDAALEEVAAHGARGATVDGIAARAGVGRVTVFRRLGSKDALIERLMARELRGFLAAVDAALADIDDPAERIAEAFVACVRASVEHPLVARMARFEPGAALDGLRRGDPSPLELGRMYVAARIRIDLGERVDAATADELADVLVRLATTYVLVPSSVVDLRDEQAARDFARRVIAPIVA